MFQIYNRADKKHNAQREQSLTLIELLITLVLISILLAAIWMVYKTGFGTVYTQFTRSGAKGELGRGLIIISQELRQASSITSAKQTSLSFISDTDNNGVDETVEYTYSGIVGEALNRISTSTLPMVNSVSSLAFTYYDANNNPLSFPVTASEVRLVAVDLTVTDKDETFNLRTKVRLRNL